MLIENRYYLIEFLDFPHKHIKNYVCIPHSWIRKVLTAEPRVKVAYPSEDPATTRRRILRREPCDNSWKRYKAIVKYVTDDYHDADFVILCMDGGEEEAVEGSGDRIISYVDISGDSDSNIDADNNTPLENYDYKITNTNGLNSEIRGASTRSSEQNNSSGPKVNKPEDQIAEIECNRKASIKLSLKRTIALNNKNEMHQKQSRIVMVNEPLNQVPIYSNEPSGSSSEIPLSIHENYSKQEPHSQEIYDYAENPTVVDNIWHRASPPTDIKNKSAMQTCTNSSNQPCPSYQHIHQQCISVVSDEFLFKDRSKREKLVTRFNEISEQPQLSHQANSSPTLIENQLHQKPRRHEIPDRKSTEVNHSSGSAHSQGVTKNTTAIPDTITDLSNYSRQLCDQSRGKLHSPDYRHVLAQNSCPNNKVITRTTDSNASLHGNAKSKPAVVQSLSHLVNQPSKDPLAFRVKQSHENLELPDENVIVQNDSHLSKIIITRSNGSECNDQTVPEQNITNDTSSAERNFFYVSNPSRHISGPSSKEQSSPAFQEHLLQGSPAPKNLVRRTTGGVPLNLFDISQDNKQNTPLAGQQFSNLENHFCQSSKPPNENHTSACGQNNLQPVLKKQRTSAGESSNSTDSWNMRFECSDENQYPLIIKSYILQNPCTGVMYIAESPETNYYHQSACIQETTTNISSAGQNVPTSVAPQFTEHSHEKQFAPEYENNTFQDPHIQEAHLGRPLNMNGINQSPCPQSIPKDTSAVMQHSPNSAQHFCSICRCSQRRPPLPVSQYLHQDPRMQPTFVARSTEKYCTKQNVYSDLGNADNTPCAIRKSFKTANQSYPTFKNSIEKWDTPILVNSSFQQTTCLKDMPVTTSIYQNCKAQSKKNTVDIAAASQNNQNTKDQSSESSIEEQNSPLYIDCVDQQISIEDTPVEIINDANAENNLVKEKRPFQSNPVNNLSNDRARAVQFLIDESNSLIRKMESNLSSLNSTGDTNLEYAETLQKVIKDVNEYCETKINEVIASTSKIVTEPTDKQNRKEEEKRYSYDDDDIEKDCDNDIVTGNNGNHKGSEKPLVKPFTLPKTYNPNDTKWTLKYKQGRPGLVELIPETGVYVDSVRFEHCKRTAKDGKTLAQMLLTEIGVHWKSVH